MRMTESFPRIAFETSHGNGPRVLFVMGFGMRGNVWKPQIDALSDEYELAYFDNRGIGESDPAPGPFTVRDLAADALRVAGALSWERFHVVGVSLGGMISQEIALLAPDRVASLTLIATHPGGPQSILPTAKGLRHWTRAVFGPQKGRVESLMELLYTPSFMQEMDRASLQERMTLQVGQKPNQRTALLQLLAVLRHDTRRRLGRITTPTLVVKPESDLLVRPLHSDTLHQAIPKARLLSLPDTGHGVTFQRAKQVNAAIREHILAHP